MKTMELFSTSAVSEETWDTQHFLCPWNQQEEQCFGKSVFAPAFALDYTSPATQNALSYQSVTTNPPWKAHKKQSELCLEISPKGHWNSFLNHGKNNPVLNPLTLLGHHKEGTKKQDRGNLQVLEMVQSLTVSQ